MKVDFLTPADYLVFEKWYLPILYRQGFGMRAFRGTGLFLDKQYPGWEGGTNSGNEHVNPNPYGDFEYRIFSRMVTWPEAQAAGWDFKTYENMSKHRTSSLPHELAGHVVHLKGFGKDGSPTWMKVLELMGKTQIPNDYFSPTMSGNYWYKPAYEDFANYMESIVELRQENVPLMRFIWELFGIEVLIFKLGSSQYTRNGILKEMDRALPNDDGRSFVPIRLLANEFQDIKLRDVFYNWEHQEVILLGGNKDEFWEPR